MHSEGSGNRQILKSGSPRSEFWLFPHPVTLGTQDVRGRHWLLLRGTVRMSGLCVNLAAQRAPGQRDSRVAEVEVL